MSDANIPLNEKITNDPTQSDHKEEAKNVYTKRPGTAGAGGHFLEINLSTFLYRRLVDKNTSFHLASNMDGAGAFDDVVFKFNCHSYFVQAKCKEDNTKTLTGSRFLADKGQFNIAKYFRSYQNIKGHFTPNSKDPIFQEHFDISRCSFIIYTNAKFISEDIHTKTTRVDETVFPKKGEAFKIIFDEIENKKIIELLRCSSESHILARDLMSFIFPNVKEINIRTGHLSKYHCALAKHVIECNRNEKSGVIKRCFLRNEGLSDNVKLFRQAIKDECHRVFNMTWDTTKCELEKKKLILTANFGVAKEERNEVESELPSNHIDDRDIKEFLNSFIIMHEQLNEKELESFMISDMKNNLKISSDEAEADFAQFKLKIQSWWSSSTGKYLTENDDILPKNIWFDMIEPVSSFSGRTDYLNKLRSLFQSNRGTTASCPIISICGIAGVGKSQLARKYAFDNKTYYNGSCLWIHGETRDIMRKSFLELAQKLNISTIEKGKQDRDTRKIAKDIFFRLKAVDKLIIFDNVEKYDDIKDFLPFSLTPSLSNRNLSILITTRNPHLQDVKQVAIDIVKLNDFTNEEAVAFVRKKLANTDRDKEDDIRELVKLLQYFPLALDQATSYINTKNNELLKRKNLSYTIKNYIAQFEQGSSELIDFSLAKNEDDIGHEYTNTVFQNLKLSLDTIKQKCEEGNTSIDILYNIAYLSPDGIKMAAYYPELDNDEKFWKAVDMLDQYSIITLENGTVFVHRLVQHVIRTMLKIEGQETRVLAKALDQINFSVDHDERYNHISIIWDHASNHTKLIENYFNRSSYGEKLSPLHVLSKSGTIKAIEKILNHIKIKHNLGNVINCPDDTWHRRTPLHYAAASGFVDVVELIINIGAEKHDIDIEMLDNDFFTPCSLAATYKQWKVVSAFKKRFNNDIPLGTSDFEIRYNEYMFQQRENPNFVGDKLSITKHLIEKENIDFKKPNINGRTPLLDAAQSGDLELVMYLLKMGANIDDKDNEGSTVLHTAAANDRLEMIRYLIEYFLKNEKNINLTGIYGGTPVISASIYYNRDVIMYLLEKGSLVRVASDSGTLLSKLQITLLHLVAAYNDWEMVKYIIDKKLDDIDVGEGVSMTPLHFAALLNSQSVIKYLVNNGAKTDVAVNFIGMVNAIEYFKQCKPKNKYFIRGTSTNESTIDRTSLILKIGKLCARWLPKVTPYAICKMLGYETVNFESEPKQSLYDKIVFALFSLIKKFFFRKIRIGTLKRYETFVLKRREFYNFNN